MTPSLLTWVCLKLQLPWATPTSPAHKRSARAPQTARSQDSVSAAGLHAQQQKQQQQRTNERLVLTCHLNTNGYGWEMVLVYAEQPRADPRRGELVRAVGEAAVRTGSVSAGRGSAGEDDPQGATAQKVLPVQRPAGVRQHHRPLAQEADDHPPG